VTLRPNLKVARAPRNDTSDPVRCLAVGTHATGRSDHGLVLIHDVERESMSEHEEGATVVELLLREPEIVAWLEPDEVDDENDEPPRAA